MPAISWLLPIFDAMYSRFQLAAKYIRYRLTALNGKGHGIHSPFVFDFVRHVLNDTGSYSVYTAVELLRSRLLQDDTILEIEDMGAGSARSAHTKRKISDIARHAAKPAKYGQLLFRIAQYYYPQNIIELGTSLGIGAAYLALAVSPAPVITLEGAPQLAARAMSHFRELSLHNVQCIQGNFDDRLPGVLENIPAAGLVFIDGNHRKAATLRYFNEFLKKTNQDTLLIFDDIHWSREMEEAWEQIREHPAVTMTIDLFFVGLVFFRQEFKIRQHFTIRY